jgi:endonuclease/exonuclease/phosphatase (EEP) superfamily protein YafD
MDLLQVAAVLTIVVSIVTRLNIPHHSIELFSHFRLQYFVVSILLMVTFVIIKQPNFAFALLATAIFNSVFIIAWYLPVDSEAGGDQSLKVVHANVLARNDKYQRLIDFIAEEDPDMIFLQEVTEEWVAGTASLKSGYPHFYAEPRADNYGIAVYSRIPFESIRHVDSPPLGYPTIVATATVGTKKLTLVSSHPTIPLGKRLYTARNQQIGSLVELVREPGRPVVMFGDFNSSLWDPRYGELVRSTGLPSARHGFGILPTWPTFLPFAMIPIDHFQTSAGIGVSNLQTGKNIGSDHLPLIATLSL